MSEAAFHAQSVQSSVPRFQSLTKFDHGKRVFRNRELDTVGLSPANFRSGGRKHVPAPYAQYESAQEVIASSFTVPDTSPRSRPGSSRQQNNNQNQNQHWSQQRAATPRAGGGAASSSSAADNNNNNQQSPLEVTQEEASSRRREKRLIEALIAFPSPPTSARAGSARSGERLYSVPRAFQKDAVDWRPSGPHDKIPRIKEQPAKAPPAPLQPDEDDPRFFAFRNPLLTKHPAWRTHPKALPSIKTVHTDGAKFFVTHIPRQPDEQPGPVDAQGLVDRLWADMEHRKRRQADSEKKEEKRLAEVRRVGKNAPPVTSDNEEEFVQRFRDQPLHTHEVRLQTLRRKYIGKEEKKKFSGKTQQDSATDRLYYQAVQKSHEKQQAMRKKYVENEQPKFAKLSQQDFDEMATRLSSREPPTE